MGLMNFFKNQMASVIQWNNQQPDVLFYKYPSSNDEIKNGSQLIVAPGQGCILVYEGKTQEVLTDEGTFALATDNKPFITTLRKFRQLGESEYKMKLYFFRKADIVNQPWGTATQIKYVDPVYQFPVELGVNGNYSFRISKPGDFFAGIVGSKDVYTASDTRQLLQSRLPQILISTFAEARLSYQQIDAQLGTISQTLRGKLNVEFSALGFELTDLQIQGTIFDPGTQKRINSISDISAESQAAAQGGISYVDMERLKALRDAARNESGLAGAGLQMGTGFELSKAFEGAKAAVVPGPSGQAGEDPMAQLQKLKQLLDEGIITQQEFDDKKQTWLGKL
jgi:membrane protease subunit (stomatin/prohibitin family)